MNTNALERIYLNEIKKLINKKDIRSVRNWCKKNEVEIYKDNSEGFVNKHEFLYAYNLPVMNSFKERYGNKWMLFYDRLLLGNIRQNDTELEMFGKKKRYQPKSKLSQELVRSMKTIR